MIGYEIYKYENGVKKEKVATMFTYDGLLDMLHLLKKDNHDANVDYQYEKDNTTHNQTHNTKHYHYVYDANGFN